MEKKYLSTFLKYSPIAALLLNFIGAILLVYHAGAYTGEGSTWVSTGAKGQRLETIYLLNPTMFKTGLWLIIIGFFIQIVNELLKFDLIQKILAKI